MKPSKPTSGATSGNISLADINLSHHGSNKYPPDQQFPFRIVDATIHDGVVGARTGSHVDTNLKQIPDNA